MSTPVLPDPELLVIDALRHYMGGLERIYTVPPVDWADEMPFIAVGWRGGMPSQWPERLQITDLELKAFAIERRQGSEIYQRMKAALFEAALKRFSNKGLPGVEKPGVLTYVREISPAGIEYEGLTSKHPDSCLFRGIFRVVSATILP